MYWRRYKIQETLYIGQWRLSPLQSRHLGTLHSSLNHHQLPCCIFLSLINSLKSLPFQGWFQFWEKPEVAGCQIWAVAGLSHLGDLMFHQKNSAWDLMNEQVCCCDEAANHQLPIAAAFWIIWIVSAEECSSLMQNLIADLLLYLLSHFECVSHTVHMTQWRLPPPLASTVRSSLFMHVHPSPLSLAARLHRCHTNCSHHVNNDWTFFSEQTSCMIL